MIFTKTVIEHLPVKDPNFVEIEVYETNTSKIDEETGQSMSTISLVKKTYLNLAFVKELEPVTLKAGIRQAKKADRPDFAWYGGGELIEEKQSLDLYCVKTISGVKLDFNYVKFIK